MVFGRNVPAIGCAVTYTVSSAHHGRGKLTANEISSTSAAATKVVTENSSFLGSMEKGSRGRSGATVACDTSVSSGETGE